MIHLWLSCTRTSSWGCPDSGEVASGCVSRNDWAVAYADDASRCLRRGDYQMTPAYASEVTPWDTPHGNTAHASRASALIGGEDE